MPQVSTKIRSYEWQVLSTCISSSPGSYLSTLGTEHTIQMGCYKYPYGSLKKIKYFWLILSPTCNIVSYVMCHHYYHHLHLVLALTDFDYILARRPQRKKVPSWDHLLLFISLLQVLPIILVGSIPMLTAFMYDC